MALEDIPLFSMLKGRLGYLNERQRLIGQNVANSDTPGYTPDDLKPFKVKAAPGGTGASAGRLSMTGSGGVSPVRTNPGHMTGTTGEGTATPWKPEKTPDSETRLDGNQVVLEEQMMKMTDARMNYDAAISFYEKSLSLLQLAIRTPGKGA
ncbi:MAG: flagellar biosynthesis protein FlgB [Caulobacteraceae bacterium]|nr:flagellar biosynthesis protein FlgB [Caulobacteraceae bacterium]